MPCFNSTFLLSAPKGFRTMSVRPNPCRLSSSRNVDNSGQSINPLFWLIHSPLYGCHLSSEMPRSQLEEKSTPLKSLSHVSHHTVNFTWKTSSSRSLVPNTVMPLVPMEAWSLRRSGLVSFFLQSTMIVAVFFSTLMATRCHLVKGNKGGISKWRLSVGGTSCTYIYCNKYCVTIITWKNMAHYKWITTQIKT